MTTQFMNTLLLSLALALGFGCTGNVGDGSDSVSSESALKGGIPAHKRAPATADDPAVDDDMDDAVDEDSVSEEMPDGASISEESVDSVSEESVSDESVSEESLSDADEDMDEAADESAAEMP